MEPTTARHDDATEIPAADVAVCGGGLAGLVAATTAARAGRRVVMIEPKPLGGRARCDTRGEFTFNRGSRALYLGGEAQLVLDDLGVDTSHGAPPMTKGAMGRRRGRLHPLPQGPSSLLSTSLLSAREKVRFGVLLARLPRLDPAEWQGTSFGTYLSRSGLSSRAQDVLRMVARLSTYAAEPDLVDAGAVLANLQMALGAGVRYLDGGFQSLIDALAREAEDLGVRRQTDKVQAVSVASDSAPVHIHLASDTVMSAEAVVVAVGTPAATRALLNGPISGEQSLTAPVTAACLELGVRCLPRHPVVFGVDEPLYLSTHRAAGLAPDGGAVVHVMRYHRSDEALDASEQRRWLRQAARDAGIGDEHVAEERFLAQMVVSGGLPNGDDGGTAARPKVADGDRPGVFLAGDWVGPRGLLSDAAAESGADAGRKAATRSSQTCRRADTMVR